MKELPKKREAPKQEKVFSPYSEMHGQGGQPPETQRVLPHSVEAEQGVLGSLFVEPQSIIRKVLDQGVNHSWFYVPAHQTSFNALVEEWREGAGGVDLITFTQLLRDRGLLDAMGGTINGESGPGHWYLSKLFGCVPSAVNLPYYLNIVHDKFIRRQAIATWTEGVRKAYAEQDEDARELVASIQTRLEHLATPSASSIVARSLTEYYELPIDNSKTLLGNRFLSREGGCLLVGPSGVGKSSASVQQDVLWALGREAFGIKPARLLKILTIQAENDEGDMTEMARGIFDGLELSEEERATVRKNCLYVSFKRRTGTRFLTDIVVPLLAKYRPDILRLDPLNGYLGGDPSDAELVSSFVRDSLNPILERFQCAVILNHHTPKTTGRDTSGWKPTDFSYAGAGNADLTNWARAVIVIEASHDPHVFKFIASKRGNRLGWTDENGEPVITRHFSHSRDHGKILWHASSTEEIEHARALAPSKTTSKTPKTKEDLMALIPLEGAVLKNTLLRGTAKAAGFGEKHAIELLKELIADGMLCEWRSPRRGTNPEKSISRHEQTLV